MPFFEPRIEILAERLAVLVDDVRDVLDEIQPEEPNVLIADVRVVLVRVGLGPFKTVLVGMQHTYCFPLLAALKLRANMAGEPGSLKLTSAGSSNTCVEGPSDTASASMLTM